MKDSYFSRTLMPVGFVLGLFVGPQNFILTTPDNTTQIGNGMFEYGSGNSVQVRITLRGKEFSGAGTMLPPPPKQNSGVRSDRAFMAPQSVPYSKHGFATLNAKDGAPSSLTCELYFRNEQVSGHCFDPADKQSPAISVFPSHEKQP